METTPQYARVEPYDIKKFVYPPTKRQALAIKNIVNFYDFNLQSFVNRYNKTGRKILLVVDDFITYRQKGSSDLDRNCIYSGEEGGVLQNILAYCMGQAKNAETVKEVAIVNWAFGRVKLDSNSKGNSTKDIANIETANASFYKRLLNLIEDYEPDTVVLAGLDMFHYCASRLKNDDRTNHRIYTNRLISVKHEEQKFKLMGCIGTKKLCAWEGVQVKEDPSLIGFFCHGMIQALNNRNTYTLHIPEDVKFINVNTIERFDRMYKKLWRQRIVSIDTETESLARLANILYTIQFCWDGKIGYVVPVDHPDTPFTTKEIKYIKAKLQRYFEFGKSLYHIYQNGKFDVAVLYATLGVRYYNHRVYDTQAGEYFFDENKKLLADKKLGYSKPGSNRPFKPYALDFIAESYGCKVYRNIEFSKGNRGSISTEGLTKRFIEYAAYDVIVPFHIQELQIKRAKAQGAKKYLKFVCEQLGDTIVACAGMEHVGAYVSKAKLFNLKDKNGPLKQYADQRIKDYETSPAAIQVNEYLKKKAGVPEAKGVFRKGVWLFDIKNQKHQQLIFFKALKLEGLGNKKDSADFQVNQKFKKTYADVPDVQRFNEIGKASILSSTFIAPTYLKIKEDADCKVDSRIRSTFDFLYVSSGRLCLDGDTPITVLDPRGYVKIKDIKPGDWVWSFNDNLKPEPCQVSWSGRTRYDQTVTIYYQASKHDIVTGSFKTLVCTADHPIRLRDGSYVKAEDLKPGDRVLALERRYSNGYRVVSYTGIGKGNRRVPEHRLVFGYGKKRKFIWPYKRSKIIHHLNEVKDDNVPSNLIEITQSEHYQKYHRWDVERKRKVSQTLKAHYKAGRMIPSVKKGKEHPGYRVLDRDWAIKVLRDNKWKPTAFRDKYGWDYETIPAKLKELGINWKKKRYMYNGEDKLITKQMLKEARMMRSIKDAAKFLRVNYYKAQKLLESDKNHQVIKVVKNEGKRWTYDITVPKYNNFIANGICVHNSSSKPNLQNLPQRSDLAKYVKDAYEAIPGTLGVENDYSAHEVREWGNEAQDDILCDSFYIGLKYRQEFRILAYKYAENIEEWYRVKARVEWDKKIDKKPAHSFDDKMRFIKEVNNAITREIGLAELELEAKGDIHKLNCVRFFSLNSPLEVTEAQRYEIKAIVFGVIYGKTATGLAKPVAEMGLGKSEEYCQELIDTLFTTFPQGYQYLLEQHKFGRENLYVENKLGMQRHLWAYLHNRPAFLNGMDRRGPNCVDMDTQCLTKDGWKYQHQLKVGEEIYTKNVETGDLELQPIRAIKVHDYKGKMWRLDGAIDALVTPNHRWLIDTTYGRKKKIVPQMADSEYIANSKNNNPIHLSADRVIQQEGDGTWSDDEVSLIGWILTDGHYNKGKDKRIGITQSLRSNTDKVKVIDKLLKSLNIKYSRFGPDDLGAIRWRLSGKWVQKLKSHLPKKIMTPAFLNGLSSIQLKLLYDAMMLGNGNYSSVKNLYVDFGAGSKKKADAFSMLCVLLGISTKLRPISPRLAKKQYDSMPNIPKQTKVFWTVLIKQRNRAQAMFCQSWVKYDGQVWCPNIKNGTFIARRGNSVYVTGNTIFQGTASQIGITSIRQMQKIMWHFFIKHGVKLSHKTICNYVHDSVKSEVPYFFIPVYLYLIEHASSTLIHRRYQDLFGYKLKVGLELEFQLGATGARVAKWDFSKLNLMQVIEKEMTHQVESLGHTVNIKKELKTIKHNLDIVCDLRLRELEKAVKSKEPSRVMLMKEANARSLGLLL